jgi:hypothetical protein
MTFGGTSPHRRRITDRMRFPSPRLFMPLMLVGGLAACAPGSTVERSAVSRGAAQPAVGVIINALTATPPAGVCAATPGVLLQPVTVAPDLAVTSLGGRPALVLLGQPVLGAARPDVGFEWTADENAAVRDLPANFGPRNASALVPAFPTRIDQIVETANTFATVADAIRWFATWPGVSALPLSSIDSGSTRDSIPTVALLTQADEAIFTNWSDSVPDTPSELQYVMRTGDTVITIEFDGGDQVSEASTETYARAALELVIRKCAGLLSR